jgi:hypothetical protein
MESTLDPNAFEGDVSETDENVHDEEGGQGTSVPVGDAGAGGERHLSNEDDSDDVDDRCDEHLLRRSTREVRLPSRYEDYVFH